jgi:hypothetical protein
VSARTRSERASPIFASSPAYFFSISSVSASTSFCRPTPSSLEAGLLVEVERLAGRRLEHALRLLELRLGLGRRGLDVGRLLLREPLGVLEEGRRGAVLRVGVGGRVGRHAHVRGGRVGPLVVGLELLGVREHLARGAAVLGELGGQPLEALGGLLVVVGTPGLLVEAVVGEARVVKRVGRLGRLGVALVGGVVGHRGLLDTLELPGAPPGEEEGLGDLVAGLLGGAARRDDLVREHDGLLVVALGRLRLCDLEQVLLVDARPAAHRQIAQDVAAAAAVVGVRAAVDEALRGLVRGRRVALGDLGLHARQEHDEVLLQTGRVGAFDRLEEVVGRLDRVVVALELGEELDLLLHGPGDDLDRVGPHGLVGAEGVLERDAGVEGVERIVGVPERRLGQSHEDLARVGEHLVAVLELELAEGLGGALVEGLAEGVVLAEQRGVEVERAGQVVLGVHPLPVERLGLRVGGGVRGRGLDLLDLVAQRALAAPEDVVALAAQALGLAGLVLHVGHRVGVGLAQRGVDVGQRLLRLGHFRRSGVGVDELLLRLEQRGELGELRLVVLERGGGLDLQVEVHRAHARDLRRLGVGALLDARAEQLGQVGVAGVVELARELGVVLADGEEVGVLRVLRVEREREQQQRRGRHHGPDPTFSRFRHPGPRSTRPALRRWERKRAPRRAPSSCRTRSRSGSRPRA